MTNNILLCTYPRSGKNFLRSYMEQQLDCDTTWTHERNLQNSSNVITLVRDPKDCIVSWAAMEMYYETKNPTRSAQKAEFYLQNAIIEYMLFFSFINKQNAMFIKFEDVVSDINGVIDHISNHFNISVLTKSYVENMSNNTKERHILSSSDTSHYEEAKLAINSFDLNKCYELYNQALKRCINLP